MKLTKIGLGCFAVLAMSVATVNADITILAEQVGSDVRFSWGGANGSAMGSLNTLDLTNTGAGIGGYAVDPSAGGYFGSPSQDSYSGGGLSLFAFGSSGYTGIIGGSSTGTWLSTQSFSNELRLEPGYVSGSTYGAGSVTFSGQSFASLGMTTGTTVIARWGTANQDFLSLSAVPEPGTASLIGLATFGFCFLRRRR